MTAARDNSTRSLLIAAIAGGAGAYAAGVSASMIWLSVELASGFFPFHPLSGGLVIGLVAATCFAIWLGWFLREWRLALWAAAGHVAMQFGPWLLSSLVYAVLGGADPLAHASLGDGLPWPLIGFTVVVCAGFPLGVWIRSGGPSVAFDAVRASRKWPGGRS
ncbi:hypothetical protein [Maricaulis sp.]|uniref:hypothetical protein n=1 Tax=Maricaulis sp. TaxID=1486257 RepID=UPI0025C2C56D|nr:hypothetical protein [Maricaulis sp.]